MGVFPRGAKGTIGNAFDDPFEQLFKVPEGSPERDLICGVLERAVADLKADESHIRRSAEQWIFSRAYSAPEPPAFSFAWCMSMLGWGAMVPLFRNKCRHVIELKAVYGDTTLVPTATAQSVFLVEPYESKEAKREKKENALRSREDVKKEGGDGGA